MNITQVWNEACRDKEFIWAVTKALEDEEDIPFEEWALVEAIYKDSVVIVDVFHDYEDNSYKVYPTFMHRTLVEQDALRIDGDI